VESAERAYEELFQTQKPYDLLMIDHEMPQSDGQTGLKRIRKNPKFSQLPIIFMTVFGNEETRQLAWNAGANVCIVKPVESHQLFETILPALSKQQADKGYDHEDCFIGFAQVEYIRGATILAVFNENIDNARNLQEDLENTFKQVLTSATILEEKYNQQKHAEDDKKLLKLQQAGSTAMEASLTMLEGLFKEHNLDASDYLDSIMHNVTDPTLLDLFKQLSEQIAQLYFKRARQHLSMIGKTIGIVPDQQQTRS
jgi:DNA-binding response OmpR family regulator